MRPSEHPQDPPQEPMQRTYKRNVWPWIPSDCGYIPHSGHKIPMPPIPPPIGYDIIRDGQAEPDPPDYIDKGGNYGWAFTCLFVLACFLFFS